MRRNSFAMKEAFAVTLAILTASAQGASREKVLYNFQAGNDGAYPLAALVVDSAGNLYGTTQGGGVGNCRIAPPPGGCGTVFELTPPSTPGGAWTETVLYRFTGDTDGGNPWG